MLQTPIYEGKGLSAWLADESRDRWVVNGIGLTDAAVVAVRAIGPKAIPYLLATLESSGSTSNSIMKRHRAATGFRALGSEAQPAYSKLVGLVLTSRDFGIECDAINALMKADHEAIALLTQALQSHDREVRERAAFALFWDRGAPGTAITALEDALSDPDAEVRANAVQAISAYHAYYDHQTEPLIPIR